MSNSIDSNNRSAFLYASTVHEQVTKICAPIFNLGIKDFHYLLLFPDCSYLFLSTAKHTLMDHFHSLKDEGNIATNALTTTSKNKPYYFLWPTHKPNDPLFSFLYEKNIWNGMSIMRRFNMNDSQECLESASFSFDRSVEKTGFLINNTALLQNFTNYFKSTAKELVDHTNRHKLAVFENRFDTSYKCSAVLEECEKNFLEQVKNVGRLLYTKSGIVKLSKRESECLELISRGRTVKEVARTLEISPKTAEFHINNLKAKTHCNYKSELLTLASKAL